MQKYALCIYGNFNNRLSDKSGIQGYQYIKETLLSFNEFDIFIYSNDLVQASIIRDTWESTAKEIVIEPPRNFDAEIASSKIKLQDFVPLEEFRTLQNTLAFLNSRAESIKLMQNHATINEKKYDWVVTCRFDLGQIDKHNGARPQKVSEINFNPKLDSNYVYSAMWNQSNAGLADQWFYSNQENILKLTMLPQRCLEYFKDDSGYLQTITKGIPYSNQDDPFSNEFLLSEGARSINLVRIDKKDAINNHLIHKYFFLEQDMYAKHKMIGNIPNVARVMYSHTDYSDCWPIYFGQIEKYMNCFTNNYILINKKDSRIPGYFNQVLYDEKEAYVDRLLSGLNQIQDPIVFFEHEDMIVKDMPNTSLIENYSKLIKTKPIHNLFPNRFDVIRLIQGGKFFSIPLVGKKFNKLRIISRFSLWIFSLQPSLWSRTKIEKILSHHSGESIWEFERKAQWSFRKPACRTATLKEGLLKSGQLHWSSDVYPYIATAIFKGKWNFLEYKSDLHDLLAEYGIDPEVRGKL